MHGKVDCEEDGGFTGNVIPDTPKSRGNVVGFNATIGYSCWSI